MTATTTTTTTATTLTSRPRHLRTMVVASTAAVAGAGAHLGGAPWALAGALVGALWGWGIVWVCARLLRRSGQARGLSTWVLSSTALLTGLVAGAGIMAQLLSTAALRTHPQFFTDMVRGPVGQAEALPFYLFNTPLEWILIPAAALLAAGRRARHLMITVLVIWTVHRVWTYTWFVPAITDWSHGPVGAAMTEPQLAQARTWVSLSWLRSGADVAAALLTTAALIAHQSSGTHSERSKDRCRVGLDGVDDGFTTRRP
jgi:hypothetical protein